MTMVERRSSWDQTPADIMYGASREELPYIDYNGIVHVQEPKRTLDLMKEFINDDPSLYEAPPATGESSQEQYYCEEPAEYGTPITETASPGAPQSLSSPLQQYKSPPQIPDFTPALDNGSRGTPKNLFNQVHLLQRPPTTTDLARTPSKRARLDSSQGPPVDRSAHDAHEKSRRNKKIKDGFPCSEPGCEKRFDRVCDLNKHHKHSHTAKSCRPYQCTECLVRFWWPKDVKRHLKQFHKMALPIPEMSAHSTALGRPSLPLTPRRKSSATPSMAWLTKSLVMLKKLRLRTKSIDDKVGGERFIMVTPDKHHFVEVDVTGFSGAASLLQKIHHALKLDQSAHPPRGLLYRFTRIEGAAERPLTPRELVDLVSECADSEGSLRLVFKVTQLPMS